MDVSALSAISFCVLMATFLYRVKVNNALNLKMKVVQFEDVWMGDLGLDVKTEC